MPVHHLGGDSGSVFAYSDELEDWMRRRNSSPGNEAAGVVSVPKPVLLQMPESRPGGEGNGGEHGLTGFDSSAKRRAVQLVDRAYETWGLLSRNNLHVIARLFREALDLDPDNADAYAGLGHSLIVQALIGNLNLITAYTLAQSALDRALELNPELEEAKCATASLNMAWRRDWSGARAMFEYSLERPSPSTRARSGRALLYIAENCLEQASELLLISSRQTSLNNLSAGLYCWCEYLRDPRVGAYQVRQARESGRFGPVLLAVEALTCILSQGLDVSIEHIQRLIDEDPINDVLQGALGYALAAAGRNDAARRVIEGLEMHVDNGRDQAYYPLALVLAGLDERREAVAALEKSFRSGSLWSLGFHSDPLLSGLRNEPEFELFLTRAQYPVTEQREQRSSRPA